MQRFGGVLICPRREGYSCEHIYISGSLSAFLLCSFYVRATYQVYSNSNSYWSLSCDYCRDEFNVRTAATTTAAQLEVGIVYTASAFNFGRDTHRCTRYCCTAVAVHVNVVLTCDTTGYIQGASLRGRLPSAAHYARSQGRIEQNASE